MFRFAPFRSLCLVIIATILSLPAAVLGADEMVSTGEGQGSAFGINDAIRDARGGSPGDQHEHFSFFSYERSVAMIADHHIVHCADPFEIRMDGFLHGLSCLPSEVVMTPEDKDPNVIWVQHGGAMMARWLAQTHGRLRVWRAF